MYNYKLVIQYDGTRYDGWQRMGKDESINTIEYKIAEILRKMTGEEIRYFADAGQKKVSMQEVRLSISSLMSKRNLMK